MKIYSSIEEFASAGIQKTIITSGTFDGVHLGHKKILARLGTLAEKNSAQSVLLTFEPHPRIVIFGDNGDLCLLSTPEEKKELLEKAGVQHLIIHPFTKELSRVSALDYVKDILVNKLHTHTLVTGHDHRFGKNREGDINDLKEWGPVYGFRVQEIVPFQLNGVTISSTKIRRALLEGNIQKANEYLGYNYSFTGKVVAGKKLGAKLGYPTANLELTANSLKKQIPADGVYAVYVQLSANSYQPLANSHKPIADSSLKGMMSIGMNPTIAGKGRSMEVHIFNFNSDIYNQHLHIFFYKKIRDEEKFNSLTDLKNQLDRDKETVLSLLK